MKHADVPDPASVDVIDLDAFRSRLKPELHEDATPISSYTFIDGPTFQAAKRIYGLLDKSKPPDTLGVFERAVSENPHKVYVAYDLSGGEYFAIERSRDDVEALLVDLDVNDEVDRKVMREPLLRYYTATLMARTLLKTRYPYQRYVPDLPSPTIGSEEFNLQLKDNWTMTHEWLDITRWRAAAGVGLLAVTHQRKDLREQMKDYLNERLDNHFQYMLAISKAEEVFGIDLPDEDEGLNRMLIGICNPLDERILIMNTIRKSRAEGNGDAVHDSLGA